MSTNLKRWLGRTAYQIMPDRFCKQYESLTAIPGRNIKAWDDRMPNWEPGIDGEYANDYFYCGNLKGITSKLEYLKNLGFDMIYLNPIEESFSYHHYDPENQREIDQWLGTWTDFAKLCDKAHELGILVVVDLVFNHMGIRSIYFNDPQYAHWIKRKENGDPVFWWGFKDLPECNTKDTSYQEAMTDVVKKYLGLGADGIRLDLGENLPKEFLDAIGKVKEEYPETIIIGEMWGIATDKNDEDAKIFDGQLDSVMNYPLADAILRWTRWGVDGHFRYNFERVYRDYPVDVQNVLLNNIATHDTPTTMTMMVGEIMNGNIFDKQIWDIEAPWRYENGFDTYGFRKYEMEHDGMTKEEYELAKQLTKVAIAILYTIPGIPCIYQGTEIADVGYKDPFNRKPYDWNKDEEDMKQFVATMGTYRAENKDILAEGKAIIVRVDSDVLILERYLEDGGKIYVAVNRTDKIQNISLPNDTPELKIIFATNNESSKSKLAEFGIIIARQ